MKRGERMAWWLCIGAVVACVLWGKVAVASPEADAMIDAAQKRCETRIEAHAQRATSARHAANILLVVGASTAALGSALAGFLTKAKLRKAMAIGGAAGAVLAVVPKTLDDPGEVRVLQKNAERHHDVAVKVQRQLIFFEDPAYKKRLAQYVIARLSDCEAKEPPEKLPDLPLPASPPPDGTAPTGASVERILLNVWWSASLAEQARYYAVTEGYDRIGLIVCRRGDRGCLAILGDEWESSQTREEDLPGDSMPSEEP
jgi:hypothetical protein